MQAYIIRRLALIVPTLFFVTILVFFIVRLVPGDIIDLMIHEQGGTIDRATLEHKLGFDVPIHVQYGNWLWNMLAHGDLGKSLWREVPVTQLLLESFPVSFELGFLAILVAIAIAFPIGILSAMRQDTISDYIGRSVAILFICLPSFWLGTIVIVFPSIWWGWSPQIKLIPFVENPLGNLLQFIIPAVILGMVLSGTTMRMTRTMMLEVLRQDYIRTAWSKGLQERMVILRHALQNALIPVVTIIGMQLPIVIGGSVILEKIFTLPGIGWLLVDAINSRDYTIISGVNVFLATFILFINLGVDLTYSFLDPRVRYR